MEILGYLEILGSIPIIRVYGNIRAVSNVFGGSEILSAVVSVCVWGRAAHWLTNLWECSQCAIADVCDRTGIFFGVNDKHKMRTRLI